MIARIFEHDIILQISAGWYKNMASSMTHNAHIVNKSSMHDKCLVLECS